RRRHTRCYRDWSSEVCSSDLSSLSKIYWPLAAPLLFQSYIIDIVVWRHGLVLAFNLFLLVRLPSTWIPFAEAPFSFTNPNYFVGTLHPQQSGIDGRIQILSLVRQPAAVEG